jgi:hypothetical protein
VLKITEETNVDVAPKSDAPISGRKLYTDLFLTMLGVAGQQVMYNDQAQLVIDKLLTEINELLEGHPLNVCLMALAFSIANQLGPHKAKLDEIERDLKNKKKKGGKTH